LIWEIIGNFGDTDLGWKREVLSPMNIVCGISFLPLQESNYFASLTVKDIALNNKMKDI